MATVFVSHSGRDRARAEEVAAALRAAGVDSLFVDVDPEHGIPAGRDWERELYAQLRRADAVVLVASAAAAASPWCLIEIGIARSLGRPVLPLRVEPGVTIPLLDGVQWTDAGDGGWAARLLAGLRAAGVDPEDAFAWDPRRSPYPGLAPFGPEDAAVFFGRDEEIRRLREMLTPTLRHDHRPVVAVAGPSGSGKSSLVHAGLLPRLIRDAGRWTVLPTVVPSDAPVRELAASLAVATRRDPAEVRAELNERPDRVVDLLPEPTAGSRPTVLLVVDQAEELLTRAPAEEQRRFLDLLERLRTRAAVVVTVRPGFLSGTPERAGLARAVGETLLIEPVDPARLREVIMRPARRAGLEFDDGLVERMVGDTAGGDALPLLAHTLRELAEAAGSGGRVTTDSYTVLGGVLGALENRADRVAAELGRAGHGDAVVPTLLRFVHFGADDEPTARPLERDRLDAAQGVVVDAFVDARLLTVRRSEDDGPVTIRVAHEALLRRWRPLRDAVAADVDGLRLRTELDGLAADWERGGRDESYLLSGSRLAGVRARLDGRESPTGPSGEFVRRSAEREQRIGRRRRRRRAGIAAGVVVAVLLAAAAVYQGATARSEGAAAASRALSVAATDQAGTDPAGAAMLALAAYRRAPTAEAENALFGQYVRNRGLDAVFSGAPGELREGAVSRDGSVVAGLTDNGLLAVWSRPPGGPVREQQTARDAQAEGMGLSPDGTAVWLKGRDGLSRFDVATGTRRVLVPIAPADLNSSPVSVSSDGGAVATRLGGVSGARLAMWDAATGRVLGVLPLPDDLSFSVVGFGPGRTLVLQSGIIDAALGTWTPGVRPPALLVPGPIDTVALAPDADVAVTCRSDPAALGPTVYTATRISDGALVSRIDAPGRCLGLAVDGSGRTAAVLSTSPSVAAGDSTVLDLATGTARPFTSPVQVSRGDDVTDYPTVLPTLVSGPDGPRAAVVRKAGVVLTSPPPAAVVEGVRASRLSPDGRSMASVADAGRTLALSPSFDRGAATMTSRPPSPWAPGNQDLAFGARGTLLADRVAADRVVVHRLPDLRTVADIATAPVPGDPTQPRDHGPHEMFFDDDGRLVTAVGPDVTVWDPTTGRPVTRLDLTPLGFPGSGIAGQLLPGPAPGRLGVVTDDRPDVRIVDVASGREVDAVRVGGDLLAASFDASHRYVAVLRRSGVIEVWDAAAERRVIGPLPSIPVAPDRDDLLFTAGFVGSSTQYMIGSGSRIRVWGVDSPAPERSLDLGPGQYVADASSDGQTLLARTVEGSGYAVSLRPADWRETLCRSIGPRSFTPAERDALPVPVDAQPLCPPA